MHCIYVLVFGHTRILRSWFVLDFARRLMMAPTARHFTPSQFVLVRTYTAKSHLVFFALHNFLTLYFECLDLSRIRKTSLSPFFRRVSFPSLPSRKVFNFALVCPPFRDRTQLKRARRKILTYILYVRTVATTKTHVGSSFYTMPYAYVWYVRFPLY